MKSIRPFQLLQVIVPYCLNGWHMFMRCLFATLATVTLATSSLVGAQGSLPLGFDVLPAIAGAGVERQILISLPWPSSCLPSGATVVGTEIARKRTLTIRLDGNTQDFRRCGDIVVTYRTSVRVTPGAEGDLRALVVMNDGVYLGEITIHTRTQGSDRSQFDLTGMWYDPATDGSGLTFVHGFARDDTVFGTWYVYDALGAPRWYTIQGVQWTIGGMQAEGQIYESSATSVICGLPLTGCPVSLTAIAPMARARVLMQGPNRAQIQALTSGGTVLFTSNLIRAIF